MTTSAEQYREKAVEFLEQADRSYDATRVAMATSIAMVYAELAKTAPNMVPYGTPIVPSGAVPSIQDAPVTDEPKMPSEMSIAYNLGDNVQAYAFLQRIAPPGYKLINFDEYEANFQKVN